MRGQELACAVCHIRQDQRFGPPKRLETPPNPPVLPRGGVTRTAPSEPSEFCMGCHQFEADGLALSGKLLENTYQGWHASHYAKAGTHCQNCHRPDRQRLRWDIHDPDIV